MEFAIIGNHIRGLICHQSQGDTVDSPFFTTQTFFTAFGCQEGFTVFIFNLFNITV